MFPAEFINQIYIKKFEKVAKCQKKYFDKLVKLSFNLSKKTSKIRRCIFLHTNEGEYIEIHFSQLSCCDVPYKNFWKLEKSVET